MTDRYEERARMIAQCVWDGDYEDVDDCARSILAALRTEITIMSYAELVRKRAEIARLKAEVARLKAEVARLQSGRAAMAADSEAAKEG